MRDLLEAIRLAVESELSIALFFVLLERKWPARAQPRLRVGVLTDFAYIVGGAALGLWIGLATASLGDFVKTLHAAARMPFAAQLAVGVVLADFMGYWKHRFFHTRWMWPFHAVHHSSEDVDFLSNERIHPVEQVVTSVFQYAPLALFGFAPRAIVAIELLRRLHSVYEHANVRFVYPRWLARMLVSPSFHRWHHAPDEDVIDKNYANVFSAFDWLFGTFHVPERSAPASLGLAGYPRAYERQLVRPFADLGRMLGGDAERPAVPVAAATDQAAERAAMR